MAQRARVDAANRLLKFINDAEWYKITSTAQLEEIFAGKPRARGKTPLLGNLAPVIEGFGRDDRDTLLLILTDGEPSDCEFDELSHLIKSKPDDVFCSFAMCTDEADVVELYNKVVDPIFGCDITDDYAAECREAKRVGNALSPFQWTLYVRPTCGRGRCCCCCCCCCCRRACSCSLRLASTSCSLRRRASASSLSRRASASCLR